MAVSKKTVSVPDIHPPLPISQAVITNGFVYISGVVGCDKTAKVVDGGIQAERAGTKLANVVKVNIYLANFDRDFASMNEVYVQFFGTENPPARTCVGVAKLPLNSNVEMECVAAMPP
ncbi:hypothetical protein AGABI1DRAFT_85377 [Agaricus bisporus var. burnettii JB137-S8]|uniref:Uncharacterized protein n=1 Tax=Agaricus bisporus var. burnettii (strain JB137-S8 / ATCC MYA-4627 / FGSC 10392) TaxID=597362 RepID=K5VYH6_AGABU|nr:uncharacterized protein AGABI1DRAFT_85377 [Agaricus bisporus var. burnettii JB137-S8]EKM79544.1 hypothetical protein AGABI1DRAFT_85377 [Agaricus bisporus var. burnettii JB137-S8]